MSHSDKRAKTSSGAAPFFTDIDISKLTIGAKPMGTEMTKYATVEYEDRRLSLQLVQATGSLRVPFPIDDGSRFNSKPSVRIELPPQQLTFFQGELESKVKEAAIQNKEAWFGAIKPLPTDDDVRNGFVSRVSEDPKFAPNLKVNVNLGPDSAKRVRVSTACRTPNGKLTQLKDSSPDQVSGGCYVIPVLRTAGGVWINVKAKKGELQYGLCFEASDLLVVEENATRGAGVNLGGIVESESEEEDNAQVAEDDDA